MEDYEETTPIETTHAAGKAFINILLCLLALFVLFTVALGVGSVTISPLADQHRATATAQAR